MKKGYQEATIARLQAAGVEGLGGELGRLCILHGYSVAEIAGAFEVSRQTAYNWILGVSQPSKHLRRRVQLLVDKLKEKPIPNVEPTNEDE